MWKLYAKVAVVLAAAVSGVSHAQLTSGPQRGVIRFVGMVVEDGFSLDAARGAVAKATAAAANLRARVAGADDHVVVDFNAKGSKPIPAEVSVQARTKSRIPLRVGQANSDADVRVDYSGFRRNLLTARSGRLTVSRAVAADEPVLAVVMVAYR